MLGRRLSSADPKILLCLAAVVLVATFLTGCGKKAPPRLPDVEVPDGVTNLVLVAKGEELVLTWTAPKEGKEDDTPRPAGYMVYRSAEGVGEDACEGCPVLYQRAAKVPLTGAAATDQILTYREPLLPGTRYRFKVVPYDTRGQLGPDSNIVKIVTD